MNPTKQTEESRENGVQFRGVAWFRAGLTGVLWLGTVTALGVGMVWLPKGEFSTLAGRFMVFIVGLPLLILSAVSTVVARTLFRQSRRGMVAAIIFDVIVGLPLVLFLAAVMWGGAMSNRGQAERLCVGAVAAAFALFAGVETAWLLTIFFRRHRAGGIQIR
jgi:hypothetical protein